MMIERRLLEALDAARPNSDDLEQPAFDELHSTGQAVREDAVVAKARDHIVRFDQAIGKAMDEVPVPADLAARILARLEAAEVTAQAGEPAAEVVLQDPTPQRELFRPAPRGESRRAWLLGIPAAIAAAIAVVAGMQLMAPDSQPLSAGDASELAVNWLRELQLQSADWQPMSEAPGDLPMSKSVMGSAQGFRRFTPAVDQSAESEQLASVNEVVAYDLQRRGRRATLFVFRGHVEGLESSPPRLPTSESGGITIGLWQDGDVVYALVVPKGLGEYSEFIKAADLG